MPFIKSPSGLVLQVFRILIGLYLSSLTTAVLVEVIFGWIDGTSAVGSGLRILIDYPIIFLRRLLFEDAAIVFAAAFLPAIVFIAIAEFRSLRDLKYYLISSALVGLAILLGLGALWVVVAIPVLSAIIIICGGFSSLVYWLIAGRHAGLWREAKAGNQR